MNVRIGFYVLVFNPEKSAHGFVFIINDDKTEIFPVVWTFYKIGQKFNRKSVYKIEIINNKDKFSRVTKSIKNTI